MIKKPILRKLFGPPNNLGLLPFPDPVSNSAGGERVLPATLGWYLTRLLMPLWLMLLSVGLYLIPLTS